MIIFDLCRLWSSQLFAERSKEHEKYGGDPDQPHKLHLVTRVKSVIRRPYWEKEIVKYLGLQKVKPPGLVSCDCFTVSRCIRSIIRQRSFY